MKEIILVILAFILFPVLCKGIWELFCYFFKKEDDILIFHFSCEWRGSEYEFCVKERGPLCGDEKDMQEIDYINGPLTDKVISILENLATKIKEEGKEMGEDPEKEKEILKEEMKLRNILLLRISQVHQ